MLSVFFIGAASAQASPVRYGDIVAMATVAGQSGRPSVDLRMRPSGQQIAGSQQTASTKGAPAQEQNQSTTPDAATSTPASSASASLTGTEVAPQQPAQQTNVDTIDLGEVQGTICDCGAIRIPGGFPKWPLLALGAVPFFFINHGCDTSPCTEEIFPTPTPTPPGVPEPATIFLLGTGLVALGARARRAYSRRDDNNDNEATGEV